MIPLIDLHSQYLRIKDEIDDAITGVMDSCAFINGPDVKAFARELQEFLSVGHIIPVANGTDALQISLMALGLQPGDEVIVPAFTYAASAEAIALLKMVPVMVDVNYDDFNISVKEIEKAITLRTRAIIPVHLFGQAAQMEEIMIIARRHHLFVIEDNAQSIGATCEFSDGTQRYTGTIGDLGCVSFFPSKNLGCIGDGGAILTNDDSLADKAAMIAIHGQQKKYYHQIIGCNSRLDSIQAAVLRVKLHHLDDFTVARQRAAMIYDRGLQGLENILLPGIFPGNTHVYHQYTLRFRNNDRDAFREYLRVQGVASAVYYPMPLNKQPAFQACSRISGELKNAERLSRQVLSIPIHPELDRETQRYIITQIRSYGK
jgi:UDP-2-acetamido-2-deoxy-ribo-hexuluronate aminotransferase